MTIVQRGHMPPPEPDMPGMFVLADPDRVRELAAGAGFGEPLLEEIAFDFHYADFDDVWDALLRLAGSLAKAIGGLPEDERKATREAIKESMEPFRKKDDSYAVPAATWGVRAD